MLNQSVNQSIDPCCIGRSHRLKKSCTGSVSFWLVGQIRYFPGESFSSLPLFCSPSLREKEEEEEEEEVEEEKRVLCCHYSHRVSSWGINY